MKLLLDTHVFLWAAMSPHKLPPRIHEILSEESGSLLSAASLWEIAIKVKLGKLPIPKPSDWLRTATADLNLTILAIRGKHAIRTLALPDHHRDPFDRILVAQSLEERVPIATADPAIARYPAEVFWQ